MPMVLANEVRPLLFAGNVFSRSRTDLYFADSPEFRDPFLAATSLITRERCRWVGLDASQEQYEYPLLVLLRSARRETVISHAGYQQLEEAHRMGWTQPSPCAVVCLACQNSPWKREQYKQFRQVSDFGNLLVFSSPGPGGG